MKKSGGGLLHFLAHQPALALGMILIGTGAWIGGVLAEHAGYWVTGLLGFAGCALGLLVGFPSLIRALEERSSQPVAAAIEG
jgi:predicted MFS family arabinose efflux permease